MTDKYSPIASYSIVVETIENGTIKKGVAIQLNLADGSDTRLEIQSYAESAALLQILNSEPNLAWDRSGRILQVGRHELPGVGAGSTPTITVLG